MLNLPPIICLSTSGGFEHQLEALEGQPPTQLGSVMQGLIGAANQDHNLARVFSTFTATNPSIFRGGRTRTCKCLLYELEPLDRPKRDDRVAGVIDRYLPVRPGEHEPHPMI